MRGIETVFVGEIENSANHEIVHIDNGIETAFRKHVTAEIDKGGTCAALLMVKLMPEIIFRVIFGLHDGVIDFCALNVEPSNHIRILFIKGLILREDVLLRPLGLSFHLCNVVPVVHNAPVSETRTREQ